MSTVPTELIEVAYEEYAREYLRKLPPEHFMESTAQARQREITLASLALVRAARAAIHVFNELLVQYPVKRRKRPGQVVPDNMVVVSEEPITAELSYSTPVQPAGPFWVMEYVSRNNKRKDYKESFRKYERELRVPYYLIFYPDKQDLRLYRHTGEKYVKVKPNEHGRYAVSELKIEVALLDGWVRFWYEGKLLPLPEELQRDLDEVKHRLAEEKKARRAAEDEVVRLRRLLEQRDKNG
jgi:Uma2 family endonuclease